MEQTTNPAKLIEALRLIVTNVELGLYVPRFTTDHSVYVNAKKELEAYDAGKSTGPANDITTPVLFAKNVKLLLETQAKYAGYAKKKEWVVAGPLLKKANLLKAEIEATADEIILGCSQGKLL